MRNETMSKICLRNLALTKKGGKKKGERDGEERRKGGRKEKGRKGRKGGRKGAVVSGDTKSYVKQILNKQKSVFKKGRGTSPVV